MGNSINYDIGAIVVLLILMIAKGELFNSSKLNKNFRTGLFMLILACTMVVLLRCGEKNVIPMGDKGTTIVKTLYFFFYIVHLLVQITTMCMRVGFNSDVHRLYVFITGTVTSLLLLININNHDLFVYNGLYMDKGKLYFIFYILYSVLFADMAVITILYRKKLRKSVVFSSLIVVLIPLICFMVQAVLRDVNLVGFGSSLALLIYGISLGDDDYDELQETRLKLEESRIEERENREKADAAYRVKQRFMKKVSTDFMEPIKELQTESDELINGTKDELTLDYANQIKEAGDHLMNVVEQMIDEAKGDIDDEIC